MLLAYHDIPSIAAKTNIISMNDHDDDTTPSCPPQLSTTKKRRRFTLQEKCVWREVSRKKRLKC